MTANTLIGQYLIDGYANGAVVYSDTPLSFWGGVDPKSAIVTDRHHPLCGCSLAGNILAIPRGRGSSSGSGVLLELILTERAPAALIFQDHEEILTLGAIVASVIFNRSIPVVVLEPDAFALLRTAQCATVNHKQLAFSSLPGADSGVTVQLEHQESETRKIGSSQQLTLTASDRAAVRGEQGKARQLAMKIVIRMAQLQRAGSLIDVSQGHIDACVYNGPSSLQFANALVDSGAQVSVPTTLNALSIDQRRCQQQGVDPEFAKAASDLGDAYGKMGAQKSFTCAPYLLDSKPCKGDQIAWAESNAVVYANSVLGARTQKYADFLDVCIAITGRAPGTGCHLDTGRLPSIAITVDPPGIKDDSYWPLMGYHAGQLAGFHVPILYGLESAKPTTDDLKAFCAAFATTSSTAMVHIAGVTPEAESANKYKLTCRPPLRELKVERHALLKTFKDLNTARSERVDMICLGNPHFSLTECAMLAYLCTNRCKHSDVRLLVTLGRSIHEQAVRAGYIQSLEEFGAEFITDTCWCMISQPIIAESSTVLMTNSAKYAHYGPGLTGKAIYFASLSSCLNAACTGTHAAEPPDWLTP